MLAADPEWRGEVPMPTWGGVVDVEHVVCHDLSRERLVRGLSASCREGATRDGQRRAGSAQLACHFSAIVRTGVGVGLVLGSDRGAAAVSGWRASCDGIPSACLLRSSSSCRAPNDCAHIMLAAAAARGCSWPRLAAVDRRRAAGQPSSHGRRSGLCHVSPGSQADCVGAALAAAASARNQAATPYVSRISDAVLQLSPRCTHLARLRCAGSPSSWCRHSWQPHLVTCLLSRL